MSKIKGSKAERELVRFLWDANWAAVRVAGSGSCHFPSPDIVARNRQRTLAIECKTTKEDKKYFYPDEINQLREFSNTFGAEPWIAVKFRGEGWKFVMLEDLKQTGASWLIDGWVVKNKGLSFSQLIE